MPQVRRHEWGTQDGERATRHAFSNRFDEPAKVLCTITPGVLGAEYFREIRVGCWVRVGRLIRRRWVR